VSLLLLRATCDVEALLDDVLDEVERPLEHVAHGDRAFRGLRDGPGAPVFLCPTCIRRLKQPAVTREEKPA